MEKGRAKAFISYSHSDEMYFNRLQLHLRPLEKNYKFAYWSDRKLKAGDLWKERIIAEIEASDVIVMLVSADFLASDFVVETELPRALANAQERGARIMSILASPCLFEESELGAFQAVNSPNETLQDMQENNAANFERVFLRLAREIISYLKERAASEP